MKKSTLKDYLMEFEKTLEHWITSYSDEAFKEEYPLLGEIIDKETEYYVFKHAGAILSLLSEGNYNSECFAKILIEFEKLHSKGQAQDLITEEEWNSEFTELYKFREKYSSKNKSEYSGFETYALGINTDNWSDKINERLMITAKCLDKISRKIGLSFVETVQEPNQESSHESNQEPSQELNQESSHELNQESSHESKVTANGIKKLLPHWLRKRK